MNNMKQAVFTVDPDGSIVGPVSKFAETLFEEPILNDHIFEKLYKSIPKDSEEYASVKSAFLTVYGEGELQWSLMEDVFPSRVVSQIGSKEKILKVTTSPLWNDDLNVERLMYIVEDVTEIEALTRRVELEKAKSGRSMAIVQELLTNTTKEVIELFRKTDEMIAEIKTILDKNSWTKEDLGLIFRHLHTIKGNSRSYSLNFLSGITHKVESEFCTIRDNAATIQLAPALATFRDQWLPLLLDQVQEYRDMMSKLYQSDKSSGSISSEVKSQIIAAREILSNESQSLSKEAYSKITSIFTKILDDSSFSVLKKVLVNTIVATAADCGKNVEYQVNGNEFILQDSILEPLKDSLVHIARNSIDHGIESGEARQATGKETTGHIEVNVKPTKNELRVEIKDDGGGINTEKLANKAILLGFMKAEEAANASESDLIDLLFKPGFSTKDQVTETSGRGVGLDVVKVNVEKLGGKLEVQTSLGKGTTFVISLPVEGKIQMPS